MSITVKRAVTSLILLLAAAFVLTSCGGTGGSTQATTARAVIKIMWPKPTTQGRFIHLAADRIRIEVRSGTTIISTKESSEPVGGGSSFITFDSLPLYPLTFTAEAYQSNHPLNKPGAPEVLSKATQQVQLTPGPVNDITFTLASQTAQIVVLDSTGAPVTTLPLVFAKTYQLSAVAKDAKGNNALTAPGDFVWKSDNTSVADVNAKGLVTVYATSGHATITVTEAGSPAGNGINATVPLSLGTVVVDFEHIAAGEGKYGYSSGGTLNHGYQAPGIKITTRLGNIDIGTGDSTDTPRHYIAGLEEFGTAGVQYYTGDINMNFDSPTDQVSFYFVLADGVKADVYDVNNTLISTVSASSNNRTVSITRPQRDISRVTVKSQAGFLGVDTIKFKAY